MSISAARLSGLLYLGLAITGMTAFLFVLGKVFVEGDAVATATNLVSQERLTRVGIAAELALVAFQALTAVWFYKLFKNRHTFAAILIAVFGMVNAVAILIAAAMWLSALNNALSGASVDITLTLLNIHKYIWVVCALFFGLWLLPMGYLARLTKMPSALSWFLYAGGVGYILSAFTAVLLPGQATLTELLPVPATIGEFWMIGYLLTKPVRE